MAVVRVTGVYDAHTIFRLRWQGGSLHLERLAVPVSLVYVQAMLARVLACGCKALEMVGSECGGRGGWIYSACLWTMQFRTSVPFPSHDAFA